MEAAGETVMALKFPPIKKSHIVTLLTILLSLLGGGTATYMLDAEEPAVQRVESPCPAAAPSPTTPALERPSTTELAPAELAPAGGAPSVH